MLTLYQLLRMAMVTAVETCPGTDPDRASFTTAMEAAKDQLTAAAGICPDGPADLPGAIGRAVLATLLPARRPRFSARKVKCATSRYLNRDDGRPGPSRRHHRDRHRHLHPARRPQARKDLPRPQHAPGRLACPGRPPAGSGSPPSSPASPRATGAAMNSPSSWASNPGTCSPSSANGHAWASSPAPASAPTNSTRHERAPPRQSRPTLNFAALLRGTRLRRAVDPGASADPAGLTARARPEARPEGARRTSAARHGLYIMYPCHGSG